MKKKEFKQLVKSAFIEAITELIDDVEANKPPKLVEQEKEQWKEEQLRYIDKQFLLLANMIDQNLPQDRLKEFYEHIKNKKFSNPDDAIDFLLKRKRWQEQKPKVKKEDKKVQKFHAELNLDGQNVKTYEVVIYPIDEA